MSRLISDTIHRRTEILESNVASSAEGCHSFEDMLSDLMPLRQTLVSIGMRHSLCSCSFSVHVPRIIEKGLLSTRFFP